MLAKAKTPTSTKQRIIINKTSKTKEVFFEMIKEKRYSETLKSSSGKVQLTRYRISLPEQ